MAVQLVNLRGVLEDEAEELRALLREHDIDFYETPPGNWGISLPALWLRDHRRLAEARALVEDYQARRAAHAREEYERQAAAGRHRTLLHEARERPLRLVFYGAVIGLVLYVSIKPFVSLGG